MYAVNCKWFPQQGRSLVRLLFSLIVSTKFNRFEELSPDSRYVSIQCTVWPENVI